jgi:hypothetical protein
MIFPTAETCHVQDNAARLFTTRDTGSYTILAKQLCGLFIDKKDENNIQPANSYSIPFYKPPLRRWLKIDQALPF